MKLNQPGYSHFLTLLGLILIESCSPVKNISIQILVPPEDTIIFSGIRSVSITGYPRLTMTKDSAFINKNDSLVNESLFRENLVMECIGGLTALMESSPDFDLLVTDSLFKYILVSDSCHAGETPDWTRLKEIADSNNTEMIISLDGINAFDTVFNSWELGLGNEWLFSSNLGIGLAASWTIYLPEKEKVLERFNYTDTVVWTFPDARYDPDNEAFPNLEDAYFEAFYWAGQGYGRRFIKHWMEVDRIYYCPYHEQMRIACDEARENNWRKAAEIWKHLSEHENKFLASKAAFNMAVVCEVEDKLDLALTWALKSYFLLENRITKTYIDILNGRIFLKKIMYPD